VEELKDEVTAKRGSVGEMRKRRTTLADGRYMIYYTFDGGPRANLSTQETTPKREPEVRAVAEEEQSV
jgi:mevalonate pyrophosphate decarboxylase